METTASVGRCIAHDCAVDDLKGDGIPVDDPTAAVDCNVARDGAIRYCECTAIAEDTATIEAAPYCCIVRVHCAANQRDGPHRPTGDTARIVGRVVCYGALSYCNASAVGVDPAPLGGRGVAGNGAAGDVHKPVIVVDATTIAVPGSVG